MKASDPTMKFKKFLALVLCLILAMAVCACGGKNDDGSGGSANNPVQNQQSGSNAGDSQQDSQGAPSNVNFGLQAAPDPDFDSPATGDESGKLYTIVGDYAYELDPATLQPIGDPLDPVTHLPVSNPVLDGENPSTPNNPQNNLPADPEPEPDPEPTPEPASNPTPTSEPTADTSLPNTGMFLEDD